MSRPNRRRFVHAALALTAAGVAPALAQSPAWPERPIQLIIPYPPGGSADLLARPLALRLQERLGQPVVLEYKPGAGGSVASQLLVRAKPDGHAFIMVLSAHAINASLYPKLPYDTRKDFAPVSLVAQLPLIVAGSSKLKARSVAELIAAAKAAPGELTFASAGNGNTGHLAAEYFSSVAGVKMTHIPYKGSAEVVNAMVAGDIHLTFDSISTSLPQIRAGRLHALAVTSAKRSELVPDVPTLQEAGLPGFDVSIWYALMGPAGTPTSVAERMNREIAAVLALTDMKAYMTTHGYQAVGAGPAALSTHIESEIVRWEKVVKASGAAVN